MNVLATLRGLKSMVEKLEANQKEPLETMPCSGVTSYSGSSASQTIGLIQMETEGLIQKLIDAQYRALNNDNY